MLLCDRICRYAPNANRAEKTFSELACYEISDVAKLTTDWERDKNLPIPKRPPHPVVWAEWCDQLSLHEDTEPVEVQTGVVLGEVPLPVRERLRKQIAAGERFHFSPDGRRHRYSGDCECPPCRTTRIFAESPFAYVARLFMYCAKVGQLFESLHLEHLLEDQRNPEIASRAGLVGRSRSELRVEAKEFLAGFPKLSASLDEHLFGFDEDHRNVEMLSFDSCGANDLTSERKQAEFLRKAKETSSHCFGIPAVLYPTRWGDVADLTSLVPWPPVMAFALLHCSNVQEVDGKEAWHEELRNQGPRAPKPPKNEFKVLRIKLPRSKKTTISSGAGEDGPRHRQRLHICSGYLRHLKSERYKEKRGQWIWVNPHWRGDEKLGRVDKRYELTT